MDKMIDLSSEYISFENAVCADCGLELTDGERATIRNVRHGWEGGAAPQEFVDLIAIIHKLQAGKMKAEWQYGHRNCVETKDGTILCTVGGGVNRHTWTDEQWLEAATEYFSTEEK